MVRYQGPKANGMPELHKLTPYLGVLQDRGYSVALVTDGRMSGASGKVPAAIHVTPEAVEGGLLSKLKDGDLIRLDANRGVLECCEKEEILKRREITPPDSHSDERLWQEFFLLFVKIMFQERSREQASYLQVLSKMSTWYLVR